jgi:hypothetical protein
MGCTVSIFKEEKFVWIELKSARNVILVKSQPAASTSRGIVNMVRTAASLMMEVEEAMGIGILIVIVTGVVAVVIAIGGLVIVTQEEILVEMIMIAETPEEMIPVIEEIPEEMIPVSVAEEMIVKTPPEEMIPVRKESHEETILVIAVILEESVISMKGI